MTTAVDTHKLTAGTRAIDPVHSSVNFAVRHLVVGKTYGRFGQFSGDLLVGNFSFQESEINAFDLQTHKFEGTIPISAGSGHTPGGLWTLAFGGGGRDGSPSTLYFTDGIDSETHGLFGAIESVPLTGVTQQLHVDETSQQLLTIPQHAWLIG